MLRYASSFLEVDSVVGLWHFDASFIEGFFDEADGFAFGFCEVVLALVDPCEDADHDRVFSLILNRTTKDRGIPFVEHLDDPVIINGFSALCDVVSAGRTGGDIFGQQLAAALT